ncbi:hypothetical protein BRD00_07465 [Halobacteriales archaeon QS_8_69_26]|nr:MAG: hypothetical protein BRD00_07465 [Halobacteriales archaeon QS_8_69_26]
MTVADDGFLSTFERTGRSLRARASDALDPLRSVRNRAVVALDERLSARAKAGLWVAVVLVLFAVPLVTENEFYIDVLIRMFQLAVLAQSFNIIAGYAGLFSLGHVAFYGLGAYSAVLLTNAGVDPVLTLLAGGVVAVAVSVPVGVISITATGIYFALVTLALAEMFRIFFLEQWEVGSLMTIGGSSGEFIRIGWSDGLFYWVFLMLLVAVVLTTYHLKRSMLGLNFEMIREDETLAQSFGIDVRKYKLVAFVISAFFPGVVGSAFAMYSGFIIPGSVFSVNISVGMQVQAILGGLGTVFGPILGAFVLLTLEETFATFSNVKNLLYGFLMIVLMLYLPGGLLSLLKRSDR